MNAPSVQLRVKPSLYLVQKHLSEIFRSCGTIGLVQTKFLFFKPPPFLSPWNKRKQQKIDWSKKLKQKTFLQVHNKQKKVERQSKKAAEVEKEAVAVVQQKRSKVKKS